MQRTWTKVGAEYTGGDDRARVEAEIDQLDWKGIPEGGTVSAPFMPGEGIKALISELALPRVSLIAWNGYLRYPDPPESAHYGLYGIECRYSNGRARVYALDSGTGLTPLASDFWPDD